MVTAAALTDAITLLATGGVTGVNTAQDIRKGLVTPIFQVGSTSDEFIARQGVLVRGGTSPSMKVTQNTTANRNIRVYGGSCVITRSSEGSYLVHMTSAVTTILLDLADATNPVVDAVVGRSTPKVSHA